MFDITAMGEVLIDFTSIGFSESGNVLFERNPGGAPANLLITASRMGKNTAFMGMVGNDAFGDFLRDVLKGNEVNTDSLKETEKANTTLAFVQLKENGERSFSFYRNPGADILIREEDINYDTIKNSRIFHFGSVSLTHEPSRTATLKAAEFAKKNGVTVSFDPNLRPLLWDSLDDAKKYIMDGLKCTDILKVSEEEFKFMTDSDNLEEGSEILLQMGLKLVFVTLGDKGCYFKYKNGSGTIDGYKVKAVDTTGAGDAFFGAALSRLCGKNIDEIDRDEMVYTVRFANAAGALATSKKGAIPAIPETNEVLELMRISYYKAL